jgi:hypothetical protein
VLQLLVTDNIVASLLILFTLITEAICSSETSVLTIATRRHIPQDDILQVNLGYLDFLHMHARFFQTAFEQSGAHGSAHASLF